MLRQPCNCTRVPSSSLQAGVRRNTESASSLQVPGGHRQFSSTVWRRKIIDHYSTLSVPRSATKAQIKTSYYQLSKKYHPDVAKDNPSQVKFHAVSEAYATLGDDRKRREYDRTLGSPHHSLNHPGQHLQATTTRQQSGFRNLWPNHPRNRQQRDSTTGHAPSDRGRSGNYTSHRHSTGPQASQSDPFMNPFVQRATGKARTQEPQSASPSGFASGAQSNTTHHGGAYQGASSTHWEAWNSEGRNRSSSNQRRTRDESNAESGTLRALGASGLVGVIMLVATVIGGSSGGHYR